ncbi:dihydrodipicolinate synthase family protein [Natronorarus salvus]|uniref:dihydrodipicolinate synthase family protein n=1 Tax=Natronorarus salvus TaxID=3117733 RepID=UPI002F266C1F
MTLTDALTGISCPIVTPFSGTEVDVDSLDALLDHLQSGGIDGLVPCGTTGEFASLTREERAHVIERTVAGSSVPVIAGAASPSVEETNRLVADAAEVGADAALVTAPYFHTASGPDGNRRFLEPIAEESPLPLVLYNIPQCVGTRIEPETVAALAGHDSVVGLKDSSGDLEYLLTLVRETPEEFLVTQGYDSLLVPALRMGVDGGINALSNAVPETLAEAVADPSGDRGDELHEAIAGLFSAVAPHGFAPGTKAALGHRGIIESTAVRPPLAEADDPAVGEAVDLAESV